MKWKFSKLFVFWKSRGELEREGFLDESLIVNNERFSRVDNYKIFLDYRGGMLL